jgi:surface protein
MQNMFGGCSGLTSIDLSEFDTSNVENMESMFYICSSLKEIKGIENWDCSKVAKFGSMFLGAKAFGGDLDLRNWKVGQNTTVTSIYSFMNWCENIKSVDMSGWILPDNTNLANFMANQGSLHTVRVIGWSAVNIQNLCSVIGCYVGGTIYGDVIIDETYLQNNWVYDNALEVAMYTCSTSGELPAFNTEFTYTHAETSNEDGTYTTKVYADSLDNLPSIMKFNYSKVIEILKWNASNVTDMSSMFYGCDKLEKINNIENLVTSNVTNISKMFYLCGVSSLDLSKWDTSNVTNMEWLFRGCDKLTSLDISGFDTKNVINMNSMFYACSNLTSLDVSGFDTSNVTTMESMFQYCGIESADLTDWDVSEVTRMNNLFCGAKVKTVDFTGWNTSKVTNMANMFYECNTIETIIGMEGFDTSSAINISGMFYYASKIKHNIDFSRWVTTENTSLYRMFNRSSFTDLSSISDWDTNNVTNMDSTFYGYIGTSLDLSKWDTSNVTTMNSMFQGCRSLISLNVSKWSLDKVNTIIPQLSASPSTSTLYGSVIIDETKLPSGWVYDNALIIAKYTANTTGLLPSFNTEFTGYTTNEIDNGDGTYTVSIATDSLDNLPTKINFTNENKLLTVDKLNTSKVTSMHQMFRSCGNLTRINCRLDTSSVKDEISQIFLGCSNLEYVDATNLVGSNIKYASALFANCTLLKQIDGLNTWDTSEVTNINEMFKACKSLTNLNVPNLCTNKITYIALMFYQCEKLETITGLETWDTSNVTKMGEYGWQASGIFQQCHSLKALDLSNWDLSKCKVMDKAFCDCIALETLKVDFTGSKPTSITYLFSGCEKLPEIQGLNTLDISEVTDMSTLFTNCKNLTSDVLACIANWRKLPSKLNSLFMGCESLTSVNFISNWDVSDVVYMNQVFYHCKKLTQIDLSNWNVSKVLELKNMFDGCSNLTELKINFTVNNTNLMGFINGCSSLTDLSNMVLSGTTSNINHFAYGVPATTLDLSGLDMSEATNAIDIYTFVNSKIVEFYPPTNINVNIDIRYAITLSVDSVVRIFNNLMTTTETKTITLHNGMLNSLTEDQIAIATNKGWTVTTP